MNFKNLATGAALTMGLALSGMPAANANVILDYTGNLFNTFSLLPFPPPYQGGSVSAEVTLAAPLPANLPPTPITPLSLTITDSFKTLGLGDVVNSILFATDASGAILFWTIDLSAPFPVLETEIITQNNPIFGVFDRGQEIGPLGFPEFGEVDNNPGTWTVTITGGGPAIPEPSTLSILGAGLLGSVLLWRRRRQNLDPVR